MTTYSQGHRFEQVTESCIIDVMGPDCIYKNVLFNKYPIYEIDILFTKDNRLFLVECKDYAGILSLTNNCLTYRSRRISNFITKFNKKVKLFNELYGVNAVGLLVMSDNSVTNGFTPWRLDDLCKLTQIIDSIQESDTSKIVPLLTREAQCLLRKGERL